MHLCDAHAFARCTDDELEVGTGAMARRMTTRNGLRPAGFRLGLLDAELECQGAEFELVIEGKKVTSCDCTVDGIVIEGDGKHSAAVVRLSHPDFSAEVVYESFAGVPGVRKTLKVKPLRDLGRLEQVEMEALRFSRDTALLKNSTDVVDIAAFARHSGGGVFFSLDAVYSRIAREDGEVRVSYPPWDLLRAGEEYQCDSITSWAYRATGEQVGVWDRSEIDAFVAYMAHRVPPRFERPMTVFCSFTNRMVDGREGRIFYSMYDQPCFIVHPELIYEDLDIMRASGIEYYQVMEGPFEWSETEPPRERVHEITRRARALGLRVGDYCVTNFVFSPHMDHFGHYLDKPEWAVVAEDPAGKPVTAFYAPEDSKAYQFCFGCRDFVEWYNETLVGAAQTYGFELHNYDGLVLAPCYAEHHDHPKGDVYQQVRGFIDSLIRLGGCSDQMMLWSNAGMYDQLLPKIAWYNHNLYLTDPYIREYVPGVNMTKILDDIRREQMVTLHETYFVPYRHFTNFEYWLSGHTPVHDWNTFEYGILQGLAVSPNLGVGELRVLFKRFNRQQEEHALAFLKHWTGLIKEHFSCCFAHTARLGDAPGIGSREIYAHGSTDHGYVFFVNQDFFAKTIALRLDERLGMERSDFLRLREVYPQPRNVLTERVPYPAWGDEVRVEVPPQTVVVWRLDHAPAFGAPMLFGIDGEIRREDGGYAVRLDHRQGDTVEMAVAFPNHEIEAVRLNEDRSWKIQREWTSPSMEVIETVAGVSRLRVTFPREHAPVELREWHYREGDLSTGEENGWTRGFTSEALRFPLFAGVPEMEECVPLTEANIERAGLGTAGLFLGAHLENTFWEPYPVWLEIETAPGSGQRSWRLAGAGPALSAPSSRACELARANPRSYWLSRTLSLPFIETDSYERWFSEHVILALPFLRYDRVKRVLAWGNGEPLPVACYRYPRGPGQACHYVDLTQTSIRPGDNSLVVWVEWE